MAYTESDGVGLYYEVHGEAGPWIVFAHGAGGNATSWWQQVPAYSKDHRVLVFDHRGFARSPCDAAQQNALHFDTDLIAIMDAAGVDRATIVCQSMGGWTGIRTGVIHKDRVTGVLLGNTPGAVQTPETIENMTTLAERLAAGGGLINQAISANFVEAHPERAVLYNQISAFNTVAAPNISDGSAYFSADEVKAAGVPVFVLASDLDPLFPPDLLVSVASAIGAESTVVEGAGHSTYFEKPAEFNAVLDRCLAEWEA